jgi:hypothetical protein
MSEIATLRQPDVGLRRDQEIRKRPSSYLWQLRTAIVRHIELLLTNLRLLARYLFCGSKTYVRDKVHLLFDAARWSKPFLVVCFISLIFNGLTRSTALAQESLRSTTDDSFLPDAPRPQQIFSPAGANDAQQTGTGSITGTVLDTNRDVLQGACVTLTALSGSALRTVESGMNGQFAFTGLPPNVYKVTVAAAGMSTFTSPQIPLHAGEARIVPAIALPVSAVSTSVTVTGESAEKLSEQQLQIAVQQRVGGVIPNFYSAYDWNAPPMLAKQKVQLSIRSIFDPVSFLAVAGIAGAEQYQNVFPAYGSGIEGYGKRYGAAFLAGQSDLPLDLSSRSTLLLQGERQYWVARAVRNIRSCDRQG